MWVSKDGIDYNPETGIFQRNGKTTGSVRNKKEGKRYLCLKWKNKTVFLHRLAFYIMTDVWPPSDVEIDHKNLNPQDNRWLNLRYAKKSENLRQRSSWSKTGFKGVYKSKGRFVAQIRFNKRLRSLGSYDTAEAAARAYDRAAKKLFGDFKKLNF